MTIIHIPGTVGERRLHFTIGPPGCGKTTLAQTFLQQPKRAVVSLDGLRHALFNGKRAFWDNPTEERRWLVRKAYDAMCYDLRERTDWDIMLPNTNLDPWFWDHAQMCFYQWDIVVHIFDDVPLKTLLERGAQRPVEDKISPEVITEYYERFIAHDAYWRSLK
ncbi:polynucleotide 5'-kinase and 3'-phosphatase protein [Rhizobium phage RHph_I72]|nr:polynucleotide 5'-kinase and 3'-phosphatase protein [Rhizobium phage RHph_I65]QIG76449.1 polynucleotide 5'-kinase and 3'-phosphatase protein [Rhizobium phage RHph_I72]